MSLDWTKRVWELPKGCGLTPTQRHILLALAEHADHAGICWPSQGRIAAMTGYARQTICAQLGQLEAKGLISRHPDGEGRLVYRLKADGFGGEGCQPGRQGVSATMTGGVSDDDIHLNRQLTVNESLSAQQPTVLSSQQPETAEGDGEREGHSDLQPPARRGGSRTAQGALFDIGAQAEAQRIEDHAGKRKWAVLRAALERETVPVIGVFLKRFQGWSPGRWQSECHTPDRWVEKVLAGIRRDLADEADRRAQEEAKRDERLRNEAEDQARGMAEHRAWLEETERLNAAFLALPAEEQARMVDEKMASFSQVIRRVQTADRPLESGFLGYAIRQEMRRRAERQQAAASSQ